MGIMNKTAETRRSQGLRGCAWAPGGTATGSSHVLPRSYGAVWPSEERTASSFLTWLSQLLRSELPAPLLFSRLQWLWRRLTAPDDRAMASSRCPQGVTEAGPAGPWAEVGSVSPASALSSSCTQRGVGGACSMAHGGSPGSCRLPASRQLCALEQRVSPSLCLGFFIGKTGLIAHPECTDEWRDGGQEAVRLCIYKSSSSSWGDRLTVTGGRLEAIPAPSHEKE